MADNQKLLNQAGAYIKKFEAKPEPTDLQEAYMALENIILSDESDIKSRNHIRATTLSSWLHMLALLDRLLDPDFSAQDIPEKKIQPPPTSAGVIYPPGADPALIDDPKTRSEYEKAIAKNLTNSEQYRRQVHLRRLDERIMPKAEAFIANAYTFAPDDRKEAKTAILETIANPLRQEVLLKACYELE